MPKVDLLRAQKIDCLPTKPNGRSHHVGYCGTCRQDERIIARRNDDGSLTCQECAYPAEICSKCGHKRKVATREDENGNRCKGTGKPVCYFCSAKKETCDRCKQVSVIVKRRGGKRGIGPGICKACDTEERRLAKAAKAASGHTT